MAIQHDRGGGFGGVEQVAKLFGVSKRKVLQKAVSGEWPSWVIAGKRVFDLGEIATLIRTSRQNVKGASHAE